MMLKGVVTQVRYKISPSKSEIKIQEENNSWWVELRGKMKTEGMLLREGDKLLIVVDSKAQESKTNTFNNLIARNIERL